MSFDCTDCRPNSCGDVERVHALGVQNNAASAWNRNNACLDLDAKTQGMGRGLENDALQCLVSRNEYPMRSCKRCKECHYVRRGGNDIQVFCLH